MRLEIVTPEGKTFGDDVDGTIVIPGSEGEMGLMVNHAPLISALKPGELRYTKDGEERAVAVGDGIVEVGPNHVSVLTDLAVGEADIDEDAVEKALERAQAALKEDGGSEERAAAEASMMKSIAMLEVARRRGKRS
ncbi:ATP synthase F1 subunit epsilon [Verrucomicrobiales bacterium]|jgi:F-type H+-transporting ATPase subunit epsilon|nr:ATP synthase F1 subunit epsilon [Verrucomicrobiales bacterium]MDC0276161.1 ATP synthase F1 subunit epsilon [Verrucomicrobiales bacterium]MDC0321738.1 ATP synthase F1 subunit epsilon [Verrucomicrobiales bacterium]